MILSVKIKRKYSIKDLFFRERFIKTKNLLCPGTDRQNVKFEFLIRPLEKIGEPDRETSEVKRMPITELPPLDSLAFDHGKTIGLYLSFIKKPFALPIMLQ